MKRSKTIMILGGSIYILPLIIEAHKKNIRVITVDYLPNNIAHRYSDHYLNISVIDKKKVLLAARKYHIDGISSFGCDAGVVTAAYVAEKMGLPSQGPTKSIEILQNKSKFRAFLERNGFATPVFKSFDAIEEAILFSSNFELPVIVKPTDSCGSKGVTKVSDYSEFNDAISLAFEKSISGQIIIEEFIEKEGCSSDADCYSINGNIDFFIMSDQWFDENAANQFVPSCISFPSTIDKKKQMLVKNELQRLISLLGLTTSLYNVEARVNSKNGKVYLMEVSPRGGGNRICETIRYACGRDLISEHIKYICGFNASKKTPTTHLMDKTKGVTAYFAIHSNQEGFFSNLVLDSKLEKSLVDKQIWVAPGQRINAFNGANDTIGTLICNFDDIDYFKQVCVNPNKFIKVVLIDQKPNI